MASSPKPWFRDDRQSYFVTIGGIRHNLGPDKEEADRLYHSLLAATPQERVRAALANQSLIELFDKFLDWCSKHREQRTFKWYRDHIQSFLDFAKSSAKRPDTELKPFQIVEWSDSQLHRVPSSKPQFIAWDNLHEQFGQGFARVRDFRRKFLQTLQHVASSYPTAKLTADDRCDPRTQPAARTAEAADPASLDLPTG